MRQYVVKTLVGACSAYILHDSALRILLTDLDKLWLLVRNRLCSCSALHQSSYIRFAKSVIVPRGARNDGGRSTEVAD